jgi:hypothetical protein
MILKTRSSMIPECLPKRLQRNNRRLAVACRLRSLEELSARIDADRMTSSAGLGADGIYRACRSRKKRAWKVGSEMLASRHGAYEGGMLLDSVHQRSNALCVKPCVNVIRDEKHLVRSGMNGNVTTVEASCSASRPDSDLSEQIALFVVRKCQVLGKCSGEIIPRLRGSNHPVQLINGRLICHIVFLPNKKCSLIVVEGLHHPLHRLDIAVRYWLACLALQFARNGFRFGSVSLNRMLAGISASSGSGDVGLCWSFHQCWGRRGFHSTRRSHWA